jgi:predicted secreted protein
MFETKCQTYANTRKETRGYKDKYAALQTTKVNLQRYKQQVHEKMVVGGWQTTLASAGVTTHTHTHTHTHSDRPHWRVQV